MQPWICQRCSGATKVCHKPSQRLLSTSYKVGLREPTLKHEEPHRNHEPNITRNPSPSHTSINYRNKPLPPIHDPLPNFKTYDTDLPLPPFLREPPKPPRSDRFPARFAHLPYTGAFRPGNVLTMAKNTKRAPFASAFAQNPYANALATPVRECAFTNMRLPRACLMDFHMAEVPGSEKGELQLLPLSLAAALVPRKVSKSPNAYHKMTKGEREAVEAWTAEDSDRTPTGNVTYMLAKREAIGFVTRNPKKRMMQYAVGKRVMMLLEKRRKMEGLVWREDMSEMILVGMRKVLVKRLRYQMSSRKVSDAEGAVQALPSNAGLERLSDADHALAALRLPSARSRCNEEYPISDDGSRFPAGSLDQGSPVATLNATAVQPPDISISQTANFNATEAKPFREDDAKHKDPEADEALSLQEGQSPNSSEKIGSTTQHLADGGWRHVEAKTLPFLDGIRPLDPPANPALLYFPTAQYRNRRIPIYDLSALLGEEMTRELIKNTVFEDVPYVVLTMTKAVLDAHYMLQKLQAYLAEPKVKSH